MSGHTPGPWSVKQLSKKMYFGIFGAGGKIIAFFVKKPSDADARLIAAAPELFEALKLCAAVCAGITVNKNGLILALEKSRAAIAAATGETK